MSTMRIGGLASGMDIDSLVEKLMQAERVPLDKLEQQKQTYEWQRDAYRDVNSKLKTLDTYIADNFVLKSLNTKTATSSNSNYVSATATSAASGTLSIEGVSQLATAARGVGTQVNGTGTTTLGDLFKNSGVTVSGSSIDIRAIQADGTLASKATKIEFTTDMTIDQFVSKINSSTAGVNAVFENGKLSVTAKNTGDVKGNQEIIVEAGPGQDVFKAFGFSDPANLVTEEGKNAIFQVNGIATERSTNTFSISGYSVTLKDTFNGSALVSNYLEAAQTEYTNANQDYQKKLDAKNTADAAFSSAQTTFENQYNTIFTGLLNYTEQQAFGSFNQSEFFSNLEGTEIDEIVASLTIDENKSIDEIRDSISTLDISDDLKGKLTSLTKDQLLLLDTMNVSQLSNFKNSAELKDFNNNDFFANLVSDEVTELNNLTINADASIEDIYTSINDDPFLSDGLKKKLITLTKEQLVKLDTMTSEEISTFTQEAKVEEQKGNYSKLGTSFLKDLSPEDIKAISEIDYTQENPYGALNEELSTKITALNESQKAVLENLSISSTPLEMETQLNELTELAKLQVDFSEKKAVKEQADTEFELSETRLDNASASLEIAEEQAANPPTTDSITPVTLTAATDVEDMITKIKEFVTTYNGLITDLTNLTSETKYRDYKPLTTAQRKELEEKEIELWEEKAKSGLLRGDSIIREGLSSMRSLLYQSNPAVANPKFNTLYNIGITTSKNYLSGGTLEIDEDKLRAALQEDPDSVSTLFRNTAGKEKDTILVDGVAKEADTRGFMQKLRASIDTIELKIEGRAGRATMVENQYTLGKYLKDVDSKIDTWQDKLVSIEDRYWRQFTAMETMINKANSQSTTLSSYFA
ncbi:flagellar filament capping protein FliD [Lysinibacillus fusiformis]|nr:flagellar filament capping protein FliD [Lysinibacillus fusiformis]